MSCDEVSLLLEIMDVSGSLGHVLVRDHGGDLQLVEGYFRVGAIVVGYVRIRAGAGFLRLNSICDLSSDRA